MGPARDLGTSRAVSVGTLKLNTFGALRLLDAAGMVIPFPEKALLAVCLLVTTEGSGLQRSELAAFLWGDDVGASANLRKMLSRLRGRSLSPGAHLLLSEGDRLKIPDGALTSDLEDMIAYMKRADEPNLERVRSLYRGEFLKGVQCSSDACRDWIESWRSKFSTYVLDALHREAESAAAQGSIGSLRRAALDILAISAHDELAYRRLMEAYGARGQHDQAREVFEQCRKRLWRDLQVEPDANTTNLARRLGLLGAKGHAGVGRNAEPAGASLVAKHPTGLPRLVLLPGEDPMASMLIEDVTIGLCGLRRVAVVAPYSARRMSDTALQDKLFRYHSIDYSLEAKVSPRNTGPTLYLQMTHVRTQEVVWAERLSLAENQIAASYRRTVTRLVDAILREVAKSELARCRLDRPANGYRRFLEGMQHLTGIALPDVRRARKSFRNALRESPNFALAMSGLARTLHLEWLLLARGDKALLEESRRLASAAIEADGEDASGYRELGVTELFLGGFDESAASFERAEFLAPQYADMIADYADTLVHAGELTEALAKIEKAIELNPMCPDVYLWTAAGANFFAQRYESALDALGRMRDQAPAHRLAAACHAMLGDATMARGRMRRAKMIHPNFDVDQWTSVLPSKHAWQREHYREGLRRAGF